jgi:hypothetical protein
MAVGKKEAGDLRSGRQTRGHVVYQLPVAGPAAGIDQGRLMAEADQVNGRITRRRQAFSSDLPEIFDDLHCSSSSIDHQ